MFWYFGSALTRLLANFAPAGTVPRNTPGCTVSSGKKVARPARSLRSRAMAALAADSFSTTMYCNAPPRAVSMATSHPGSTCRIPGHRPDDPPQAACTGSLHHAFDRLLVAVHILFQLLQH